ncbi:MAG TPA: long-chain fatty acid--CoA ligase [Thermomicrobiales bacterium]|nr:long-chain fatty acid--CoA ligase [Thermomicrobiales bacterium]
MSGQATLAEFVADVARRDGEKPALIFQDQPVTYAQLDALIERAADGLAARGVGHGDRVALMLPNIPPFVVAYYAALRLGAIVVPVNLLYKADEIAYILGDSEAKALVVYEGFYAQAGEAVRRAPSVECVVVVGQGLAPEGTTAWADLVGGGAPQRQPAAVAPGDVAVICYTSGTTGRAKGAMLTHRNFIANLEQMEAVGSMKMTAADVELLVLPLFHIYAMNVGLNGAIRLGATVVLMLRFELLPVLEQIERHRCTVFLGAPPMYVAWVNTPGAERYDVSSLRVAGSGAAPLPAAVLARFRELTGVAIGEGYGLTETAPTTHSNYVGDKGIRPGTVGLPLPGVECRLVDEHDREVSPGAEGEIVVRGENVMVGYWHQPEASAEALRGGWFHTGDIATVDADGYYTIVDRKKDMINAGGFKVWPREVEEVLYHHPAVQEAAVVPFPDPYAGERPLAFVSLKAGQHATADDLIQYCRANLASFKAPTRVEFRDDLPKLPTGKVLRRVLREEARGLRTKV